MVPFAAILGGAGLGELLRRYKYVTRRGEGVSASRPRVQVSGPKVQPLVCQICLGRIKEGTEYVRCSSGKVFHAVCLDRVGSCPYCQRTVEVKGREGEPRPAAPAPVALPPEPAPPAGTVEDALVCPVCGAVLEKDAPNCPHCGAIFVDPSGTFRCPDCRAELREGDTFCGRCGRGFDRVDMPACPQCRAEVPPNAEVCPRCGCLLHDRCPECGAELAEGAEACPVCGTEFEFV
jgi:hypothetical protein